MIKQVFMSLAAIGAFGLTAHSASAQCSQCNQGQALSPSAIVAAPEQSVAAQNLVYAPRATSMFTAQPIATWRNSYQPQMTGRSHSASRKQPWEYPKTDPRRYRP
jgi:hypothetical protein